MNTRDRAFEDWVRVGQAVKVVHELQRRGHFARLKRSGGELVGPCPLCGGTDRFGVNPARDVWNCRRCSAGGDAIALVRHLDGVDFLRAIEILTDVPPPGRADESTTVREACEARQHAAAMAAAEEESARAAVQAQYRDRERERAAEIWRRGRRVAGTPAERYLALRRLTLPAAAQLRFIDALPVWNGPPPNGTVVHRGPALLARIAGPDGHGIGVHITWIDLTQPKGKAVIADPTTGELLPAKKVRGSQRGGSILLALPTDGAPARMLLIGEGIETVLAVREALRAADAPLLAIAEFRSGVNLGNLAGRAADRVVHPSLTRADRKGRVRRLRVPGPTPLADRQPVIAIGDAVTDIVLLGDGDSEPFATRLALERGAARFQHAYPYVETRLAMSAAGVDFGDQWMAA